jgi:hypothetical protein
MGRSIRAVCLAGVVASVALLPDAASGQHFGSNKVQYKSLQFQVLKTPHFDIYFHQDEREPVDIAGRLAERWWNRLSALFGTMPEGRQPPVLYSSHAAFEQTLVVPVLIDARTGGVTGPTRRRIAMPFASSLVGPALSPDGRWVTFVSERSLVSMDLFVADAATGAIVRKLTDTAGDPHYSNLQFIDSAGAWDRGGRRLAVGTMISGRAALTIFGWPGGARQLDVMIDEVDEIFSPTWSPDRRSIAFSGMVAGVTDLFVYDLPEQHVQRLTHDPWVPCRFTREEERHDTYVVDRGGGAWRRHGVHRQSGQSVRGAHRFGAVPKSPRLQALTRQHVRAARQLRVVHVLRSLRAATATATTFEIHPPLSRVVSKGADVPVACSKHLSVSWENPIRGASARTGPRSLARACSGRGSST